MPVMATASGIVTLMGFVFISVPLNAPGQSSRFMETKLWEQNCAGYIRICAIQLRRNCAGIARNCAGPDFSEFSAQFLPYF